MLQTLLNKIAQYISSQEFELVKKAYEFAEEAHREQVRASQEKFISHPLSVALILSEMKLDYETIAAALLHDIVEDTPITLEIVEQQFGERIAALVNGVTKLDAELVASAPDKSVLSKRKRHYESVKKMFVAAVKDIRVVFIKLADRLHNMRTLSALVATKQREKSKETLKIYAPIAHRLGIYEIKWELEDLALKYLDKKSYETIKFKIAQKRKERERYINYMIEAIHKQLLESGIMATLEGRAKHFYSIYNKMYTQNKRLEEIYDLFAIRVIVNERRECYSVLGIIHDMYNHIQNRFKDYISTPKANNYRSIHTTVLGPAGFPVEIQIRTSDMHHLAESGIAAHWKYKDNVNISIINDLSWLGQLTQNKTLMQDSEFTEILKSDILNDKIFVFTPTGEIVYLPVFATPIDFAYKIGSEIGHKIIGVKINSKIKQIGCTLKNGDIVEIITSALMRGPSLKWLQLVKTSKAHNSIVQWYKKEKPEKLAINGRKIIEHELLNASISINVLEDEVLINTVLQKYNCNTLDDLYTNVACEIQKSKSIISEIAKIQKKAQRLREKLKNNYIHINIADGYLTRIAKCCKPVLGDEIMGYVTQMHKVSIHRKNCVYIKNAIEKNCVDKLITVSWKDNNEKNE